MISICLELLVCFFLFCSLKWFCPICCWAACHYYYFFFIVYLLNNKHYLFIILYFILMVIYFIVFFHLLYFPVYKYEILFLFKLNQYDYIHNIRFISEQLEFLLSQKWIEIFKSIFRCRFQTWKFILFCRRGLKREEGGGGEGKEHCIGI